MDIQNMRAETSRKIVKLGEYSYTLGLPKIYIDALGWRKGQKITLKLDLKKKEIVLKDWHK